MTKRKKRVSKRKSASSGTTDSILDIYSVDQLLETEKRLNDVSRFHWDYFYELAYQRKQAKNELIEALHLGCIDQLPIVNWFRVVRAKYSNAPLSVKGSLIDPGGRFNVGRIYSQCFPPFPALYVAEDFDTCVQEVFPPRLPSGSNGLKNDDLKLGQVESLFGVRVHGLLEKVVDLTQPDKLKIFSQRMKKIDLPKKFYAEAKRLSVDLGKIRGPRQLVRELMHKDWTYMPTVFDIPANPQIFGQLVHDAGIDAILYPSSRTGKKCLAVYTRNFENTSSEIEITDDVASTVSLRRIDRTNFMACE